MYINRKDGALDLEITNYILFRTLNNIIKYYVMKVNKGLAFGIFFCIK